MHQQQQHQQPMPVFIQQPYVIPGTAVGSANVKATRVLGIVQLILGTLCCLLGVFAAIFVDVWVRYIGTNIWGGILIIISGVLGVASAAHPTSRCLNGTNMGFAILASLACFIKICFNAVALAFINNTKNCWDNFSSMYTSCKYTNATGLSLYSILLIITLIEFAVSIAVSVYCCKQACCGPATQAMIIQQGNPQGMVPTGMTHNGQMTYVAATSTTPGSVYQSAHTQQGGLQQQPMTYTSTAGYSQPANPTAMTYGSAYSMGHAPAQGLQDGAAAQCEAAPLQTKQAFAEGVPPPYSSQ